MYKGCHDIPSCFFEGRVGYLRLPQLLQPTTRGVLFILELPYYFWGPVLIALVVNDTVQIFKSTEPLALLNRVMNILRGTIHIYFISLFFYGCYFGQLTRTSIIHQSACSTNKQ